jgi:hypothetical protein
MIVASVLGSQLVQASKYERQIPARSEAWAIGSSPGNRCASAFVSQIARSFPTCLGSCLFQPRAEICLYRLRTCSISMRCSCCKRMTIALIATPHRSFNFPSVESVTLPPTASRSQRKGSPGSRKEPATVPWWIDGQEHQGKARTRSSVD